MFDIAPSEFLLIAIVAVVVIGPKDLPMALRTALIRVLSADSDTMRPPQIDWISSSRLTTCSR